MPELEHWLKSMPPATIERLQKINEAASSSAHIILALSYGLSDPHIRRINRIIVDLMLSRHRAQRQGQKQLELRIESKLQDLHQAINFVTGMDNVPSSPGAGNACKRAIRTV